MENNWKQKSLENLEKTLVKSLNGNESYLTKRCYELMKLPLSEYTTEDLRLMIGQQLGLKYLLPLAFEILSTDLFAEGDYFEGDLLKNILAIDTDFWHKNRNYREQLTSLIKDKRNEIVEHKFDLTNFDNA